MDDISEFNEDAKWAEYIEDTGNLIRKECYNDLIIFDIDPDGLTNEELLVKFHELLQWLCEPVTNNEEIDDILVESANDIIDWYDENINKTMFSAYMYKLSQQKGPAALEVVIKYHDNIVTACSVPYEYVHPKPDNDKVYAYINYTGKIWGYLFPVLINSVVSPVTRDIVMEEFNYLEDTPSNRDLARQVVQTFLASNLPKKNIINIIKCIKEHDISYYNNLVQNYDLVPIEELQSIYNLD